MTETATLNESRSTIRNAFAATNPATKSYKSLSLKEIKYVIRQHGLRSLSSWNHPEFRALALNAVASHGMTSEEACARQEAILKQQIAEHEASLAKLTKAPAFSETVIPAKHLDATYCDEYWPALALAMRDFRNQQTGGMFPRDLYIHGLTGSGKSVSAAKLLQFMESRGKTIAWLNCERLYSLSMDGISDKSKKQLAQTMRDKALSADVLVLDDIGKSEMGSTGDNTRTLSFFGRMIYEIIEERQGKRGLTTIYTSEYALTEPFMAGRLTKAVINRIEDFSTIVGNAPPVKYTTWLLQRSMLPGLAPSEMEARA